MQKKISQLFYKNGDLRVVISTANLIDYDWRDIENVHAILFSCVHASSELLVSLGTRLAATIKAQTMRSESR